MAKKQEAAQQEESDEREFNPENYLLLAGPWPVLDGIQVTIRRYAGNPAKVRIEKVKKNGDVRPHRSGLTAEQASALAPVLQTAAAALAEMK